ncbi:hypothetical protein LX81_01357 [Palleronia aestuarii]|uniref:Uncharacterized protein n=1 Tax=Palleronia aestuarii TaxID=568105 RepID=A0A2W7P2G7_9RHOB|nr:hypothetical protein [Palleronia aestuarii]PZX17632.1 hypothetical protein LX81_01357 [Palleronia aestuarii]
MVIRALTIASLLAAGAAAADDNRTETLLPSGDATVYRLGPGVPVPRGAPVYTPGDRLPDYYGTSGADIHAPGYLPDTVPWRTQLVILRDGSFNVYVTPNVVPYRVALGSAGQAAALHCGGQAGEAVAQIDAAYRHSAPDLASWGFGGHCR